jgi:hypothetical protein
MINRSSPTPRGCLERAFAMLNRKTGVAECIGDVAQPEFRSRDRCLIVVRCRQGDGAPQDLEGFPRRIEHASHGQPLRDRKPALVVLTRRCQLIQRCERCEILRLRAIQRRSGHGLVARQFGKACGLDRLPARSVVVGKRLVDFLSPT